MKLKALTINLMVSSVERSVAFYSALLGFETLTTVPSEKGMIFAMIKRDEVTIMLQTLESFNDDNATRKMSTPGGSILLYFDVEDLDSIHAKTVEQHIPVYRDIHETFYGTREFCIVDPDNYLISFAEDKK